MSRFLDADGASYEQLPTRDEAVSEGQAAGHDFDRLATAEFADQYTVTATGAVIDGPCIVYGMETDTAGTSSTLTLYDNASAASGTVVMPAVATGTVNVVGYSRAFGAGKGVLCANGLYATVGGTGSPSFRVFAVAAAAQE